jgi:hypothetical protein
MPIITGSKTKEIETTRPPLVMKNEKKEESPEWNDQVQASLPFCLLTFSFLTYD